MATVHPLPSIHVFLTTEEKIKETLQDAYFKACRLCEMHRLFIIILVACLAIGSVVLSVTLKSVNTNVNPCYYYSTDTLASDVSIICVKYLWSSFQCSTALESSSSWHWWIQSPQGLTMVKCNASYQGSLCGVGSYNNIRNYLPLCNPHFGQ